jgi:hypothetical protein
MKTSDLPLFGPETGKREVISREGLLVISGLLVNRPQPAASANAA